MRYGALVWVGDEVVGVRTGAEAAPAIVLPAPTVAAGLAWWTDPGGPALIAGLVADLTHHFVGDELVELVLLVPAEARPELEAALGFAVPDVDVRVVPVHEAVTALLGAATRVGEWRDGALLWSGDGDRAVAVGPRELAGSVELRMATEAPDADFLSAERLVQRYAATLEPPLDDQPVAVDDDVQFTVYRPRAARPEHTERLVAFAHKSEEYEEDGKLVDPAAEVARLAEEVLGDLSGQVTTTQDADAPIARGDVLRFVPVVPGVHFNPVALEFQWLRGVHREVFEFVAGRELDGQTVTGRLSVYVGLRLVADVTLRIRVDSTAADAVQERSHGRVYGKVFPSYSHQDAVVVAQITAAAETLGHEYLRDVDRLRAGQVWQRELEQFIEQADVFQLFWSPASMMSPHVHHEWDYALSLNRPDFVRPVYWQEPRPTAPPDLPPPELDRLHFAYLGGLARAAPAAVAPLTAPSAPVTAAVAPATAPWTPATASAPVTEPAVAPPGPPRSSRRGAARGRCRRRHGGDCRGCRHGGVGLRRCSERVTAAGREPSLRVRCLPLPLPQRRPKPIDPPLRPTCRPARSALPARRRPVPWWWRSSRPWTTATSTPRPTSSAPTTWTSWVVSSSGSRRTPTSRPCSSPKRSRAAAGSSSSR